MPLKLKVESVLAFANDSMHLICYLKYHCERQFLNFTYSVF